MNKKAWLILLPGLFVCSSCADKSPYPSFQRGSKLVFSEFLVGDSISDRALELSNTSNRPIDLSKYRIEIYRGASTEADYVIELDGIIEGKGTYVITCPEADESIKEKANLVTSKFMNIGQWPMMLVRDGHRLDTLGYPGYSVSWGGEGTLVRKSERMIGRKKIVDNDWVPYDINEFSHLGEYGCPISEKEFELGPHLTQEDFDKPYFLDGNGQYGAGGVAEVSVVSYGDGDTTRFDYPSEFAYFGYPDGTSFRYQNIDTPETQHGNSINAMPWGNAAAEFNNQILRNAKHILVQSIPEAMVTETYGRLLGFVWYTNVDNPTPGDYIQLNYRTVYEGYSKVMFSGTTTSTMKYNGLSYYGYLKSAERRAAELGLKVHGQIDPNFDYGDMD